MKNKKIINQIILIPLIGICSSLTFSCSTIQINHLQKPNETNKLEIAQAPNYYQNFDNEFFKNINDFKINKLSKLIDEYRLIEWNEYYENLGISNVLNINDNNYWYNENQSNNEIKITNNQYDNQDKQFQYINDFINLINDEKTHEDFLYLRWKYYSIFGANLYNKKAELPFSFLTNKNTNKRKINKTIGSINISDWISAITKVIVEANFEDLLTLIYSFFRYYGLIPDFNQIKDYLNDIQNEMNKVKEICPKIKEFVHKYGEGLSEKLFNAFSKEFKNLFEEIKSLENKPNMSFKEFIKNFKNLMNKYHDLANKYQDTVKEWNDIINGNEDIIGDFLDGLIETINNALPKFKPPNFQFQSGLQNSVLQSALCAKDMLMRLNNKNYTNDSNYKIWELKKQRAIQICKKELHYRKRLLDSFNPTSLIDSEIEGILNESIDNSNLVPIIKKIMMKITDLLMGLINKTINGLYKSLSIFFDNLTSESGLVKVKKNEYYKSKK